MKFVGNKIGKSPISNLSILKVIRSLVRRSSGTSLHNALQRRWHSMFSERHQTSSFSSETKIHRSVIRNSPSFWNSLFSHMKVDFVMRRFLKHQTCLLALQQGRALEKGDGRQTWSDVIEEMCHFTSCSFRRIRSVHTIALPVQSKLCPHAVKILEHRHILAFNCLLRVHTKTMCSKELKHQPGQTRC